MKMNPVIRRIYLEKRDYVTSEELKGLSKKFGLDHGTTIRNLIARRYLIRIFRGFFKVVPLEDRLLKKMTSSHLDLVSKGMDHKRIDNWYFGLSTALKLNGATHESFTVDYVVNDTIFRSRTMKINGYDIKFIKLKESMFSFGIVRDSLKYSDLEKTIMDIIYLSKYGGVPEERILMDISEYIDNALKTRLMEYSGHYPITARRLLERVL